MQQQALPGWYPEAGRMRYWNGSAWTDHYQPLAPLPPPPASAAASDTGQGAACAICGRSPVVPIVVTKQTGAIVARLSGRRPWMWPPTRDAWRGLACHDCGLARAREYQAHSLGVGWWGALSVFSNVATVAQNMSAFSALRRLAPAVDAPRAKPLSPGRPVWRRPISLGLVLVIALVAGVGIWEGTHTSVTSLKRGDCFDLPSGTSFQDVADADCESPHDAQVLAVTGGDAKDAFRDFAEALALSRPDVRVKRIKVTFGNDDVDSILCLVEGLPGEKLESSLVP